MTSADVQQRKRGRQQIIYWIEGREHVDPLCQH